MIRKTRNFTLTDEEAEELYAQTTFAGDCVEWTGARRNGYGVFYVRRLGYRVGAHRAAYAIAHGEVPENRLVLHSCDNPLCVNPAHLRLGDDADNIRDAIQRGRYHTGPRNKTAPNKVRTIRQLRSTGHTYKEIARRLSLNIKTVGEICRGEKHTTVPDVVDGQLEKPVRWCFRCSHQLGLNEPGCMIWRGQLCLGLACDRCAQRPRSDETVYPAPTEEN